MTGSKAAAAAALAAAAVFLALAFLAAASPYAPGDLAEERWVQSAPWGPLVYGMELTNWIGGWRQTLLALAVIAACLLWSWRAALLVGLGLPANLVSDAVKDVVERPRPPASLVAHREIDSGFSFPSGHATFYTWLCVLVLVALWPRLPRRIRPLAVAAAGLVIVVACTGRVWAGAHWPSDVAGGFALGVLWSWGVWRLWSRAVRSPRPGAIPPARST